MSLLLIAVPFGIWGGIQGWDPTTVFVLVRNSDTDVKLSVVRMCWFRIRGCVLMYAYMLCGL